MQRRIVLVGGAGAAVAAAVIWAVLATDAPRDANLSDAPAYAVLNNGPADTTPMPFLDNGPDAGSSAASPAANGEPYYRYCSDARAAGAAPLQRGDPGYAAHLDRDGDGVACEPYRGR